MKRALVLPGTIWQIPIIKKLKEKNFEVHVCNPVKILEVASKADNFLESDIFNYGVIVDYCKEKGIDFVISDECDIATDAVSIINSRIGAIHLSEQMAALFTNKFLMRQFSLLHISQCRSLLSFTQFYNVLSTFKEST